MENFEEFFIQLLYNKSLLKLDDLKDILRSEKVTSDKIIDIENDVSELVFMLRCHVGGRENIIKLVNNVLSSRDIISYAHLEQLFKRFTRLATIDLARFYIDFSKNNSVKKIILEDLEKTDFNKFKYRKAHIIEEIFKEICLLRKDDAIDKIFKSFVSISGKKETTDVYLYQSNYLHNLDNIIDILRISNDLDVFIIDTGFLNRKYVDYTYKINLLN